VAQKTKQSRAVSERLAMAVGHPIRIDALRILNERMASPSELAKELGKGVSQVSYHIKELRRYKCIELVKTEPRRGAVEHYYRATAPAMVDDKEWAKLPESTRQDISATVLQTVIGAAAGSLQAGRFDQRSDRHLSWMPMLLDEQGWQELTSMLAGALEAAERIKAASAERLSAAEEPGFSTMVAMMGFETAREQRKSGPAKAK
jgi:DNA-binding transcriptional ArsR family regulator